MGNRKLLCVSWCDADDVVNYGQILQGCAMMYILRGCYAGEIIYASYLPRNIKQKIKYFIKHYNPFSGHLAAYIKTRKVVNQFVKDNKIIFRQITDYKTLNHIAENTEIMICGSDQIWHPQNYDKGYFLDFDNTGAKKISYAASLPKSSIEPQFSNELTKIAAELKKIDVISVREQSSVSFIADLSKKKVEHVVDPAYLVPKEKWDQVAGKISLPQKYIFVYIPNGMDSGLMQCLDKLKVMTGISKCLILMTRGKCEFAKENVLKFVEVGQFLTLIKNASYVFTSSFHAVVFSTIFHINFLCHDVKNEYRGEDLRLKDILYQMGLEDRLINKEEDLYRVKDIDYKYVDEQLLKMIEESKKFLWENITGCIEKRMADGS